MIVDRYKLSAVFLNDPPMKVGYKSDWKPFSGAKSTGMRWDGHVKENGVPHGAGRCGYTRKNFVYEGIMVDGVMQGFGRFVFFDGSYYIGQFNEGLFEGDGKYVHAKSETVLEGKFEFGSYVP